MVQLKSHQLVTSQTNSHLYNTCWYVHTPTTIPSVAHEIKVLMSSHYQQMPSWACHRWLARSQRRELTASPFKGSSPAAASPKIPLLSNSLCYIYYLHLDKILSDHPFFLFQVKLQRPPAFGMRCWKIDITITTAIFAYSHGFWKAE